MNLAIVNDPLNPEGPACDLDLTYQMDKVSCVRGFYAAHVTLANLVVLAGLGCLITRVWMRRLHSLFGRLYIIFMLWCMGTSLLIHNTGLPVAVLISFVWVQGGITVGWLCIWLFQRVFHGSPLLMAIHGSMMFMSWTNMLGRLFSADMRADQFACYTAHVYKPLNSSKHMGAGKPWAFVPERDPDFGRLPWAAVGLPAWGVLLSIVPLAVAGSVFACCACRETGRKEVMRGCGFREEWKGLLGHGNL